MGTCLKSLQTFLIRFRHRKTPEIVEIFKHVTNKLKNKFSETYLDRNDFYKYSNTFHGEEFQNPHKVTPTSITMPNGRFSFLFDI